MRQTFHELVIGGVLTSPFVTYAGAALLLVLLLRPVVGRIGFEKLFGAPPVPLLTVYVVILTTPILLV